MIPKHNPQELTFSTVLLLHLLNFCFGCALRIAHPLFIVQVIFLIVSSDRPVVGILVC